MTCEREGIGVHFRIITHPEVDGIWEPGDGSLSGVIIHLGLRFPQWGSHVESSLQFSTKGTFRATGNTAYLLNGGTLEHAQQIAAHEPARTTKLYDRRSDQVSLDEIERALI